MAIRVKNVPDRIAGLIKAIDQGYQLRVGTSQLNKGKLVNEATQYVGKAECVRADNGFYTIEDTIKCGNGKLKTVYGYNSGTKELTRHYRELITPNCSITNHIDAITTCGGVSVDGSSYSLKGPIRRPGSALGYDSETKKHIVIPQSTHTETVNYILGKENAKNAYAQLIENLKKHLPIFDK